MSSLEATLQVRGCDGLSTPQNGAAAYSQSHVFARVVSPLPSVFFVFLSVLLW